VSRFLLPLLVPPSTLRPLDPSGGGAKRLFDNHLETSSIKRYSEVAEAMSNRQYHPIEETAEVTIWRH